MCLVRIAPCPLHETASGTARIAPFPLSFLVRRHPFFSAQKRLQKLCNKNDFRHKNSSEFGSKLTFGERCEGLKAVLGNLSESDDFGERCERLKAVLGNFSKSMIQFWRRLRRFESGFPISFPKRFSTCILYKKVRGNCLQTFATFANQDS